jgi:imidazolonepropionase-like amidohydrolase
MYEGLSEDMAKKVYGVLDAGKQSIGIAQKEKITMCYGSDLLANMRKYQLTGLRLMEEAGLSTVEVIRTATINAANLLGLEQKIGSIEVGKDADIVVLTQNPFLTTTVFDNWNDNYIAVLRLGEPVDV